MTKKPNARSMGQDIMRGEGNIPADGLGPGTRKRGENKNLKGGLTHRTTADPYRAKKRAANAKPAGGGGGAWQKFNDEADKRKAKRGLALGTQQWVQDKIDAGEIDGGMASGQSGTSIFDPVLCELVYRWFCPQGGSILDPFSGGSVRGIVASHLGRAYTGIDIRPEQLVANRAQLAIAKKPHPVWVDGDSRNIAKLLPPSQQFDLVFSCPPYWNLEVYSDDPRDISTLSAGDFFTAQTEIVRAACARLKNDRFAVWVVGDVRDAKGLYVNLPGRSIQAFEDAGLRLYNEAILITAAGSLAMRAGKQFETSRKLGKSHQNVLVFVKGDPVKATKAIGPVEFADLEHQALAPAPSAAPAGSSDLAAYGRIL